jgi:hypothetical protein
VIQHPEQFGALVILVDHDIASCLGAEQRRPGLRQADRVRRQPMCRNERHARIPRYGKAVSGRAASPSASRGCACPAAAVWS